MPQLNWTLISSATQLPKFTINHVKNIATWQFPPQQQHEYIANYFEAGTLLEKKTGLSLSLKTTKVLVKKTIINYLKQVGVR